MSDSSNTPINPQDMAADLAKNVDKAARKVVSLTDKGPIKGFKKFISRGSMIDMAVGVVMGSAVTTVVNSIVNHLLRRDSQRHHQLPAYRRGRVSLHCAAHQQAA